MGTDLSNGNQNIVTKTDGPRTGHTVPCSTSTPVRQIQERPPSCLTHSTSQSAQQADSPEGPCVHEGKLVDNRQHSRTSAACVWVRMTNAPQPKPSPGLVDDDAGHPRPPAEHPDEAWRQRWSQPTPSNEAPPQLGDRILKPPVVNADDHGDQVVNATDSPPLWPLPSRAVSPLAFADGISFGRNPSVPNRKVGILKEVTSSNCSLDRRRLG